MGGVEWRLANKAVHAPLAAQVTIGVGAGNLDRGALDAGLFALHHIEDIGGEAAALRPAEVHAQEHLRPVLRFRPARTGVDREDGVAGVVFSGELKLELEFTEGLFDGIEVARSRRCDAFVGFGHREFEEFGHITGAALEPSPGLDAGANRGDLLHEVACGFGIFPECGF